MIDKLSDFRRLCRRCIWLCLLVATPVGAEFSESQTIRYIRECSADWASSVVTGDTSRMKVYFAEDFVGTGVEGGRYNKSQVLANDGPSEIYRSNTIDSIDVRLFGNTAIAHGSETWVKYDGSEGQWIWTDIWLLRDQGWQLVAAQDVEIPAKPR
ncbi:nuclear transport factor 2 family protein [Gammaproteobacteria bacterium]|nr:nuclear transport factor 2 family protein [Gammaproteobacteria bacterium]